MSYTFFFKKKAEVQILKKKAIIKRTTLHYIVDVRNNFINVELVNVVDILVP